MSRPRTDPELARRIGAKLKRLRQELGRTQEQVAWDCGVEKSYISDIEAGRKTPSLPMLAHLAAGLGVDPADLLAGAVDTPRMRLLEASRRAAPAAIADALALLERAAAE